jgi:hypothetical protein
MLRNFLNGVLATPYRLLVGATFTVALTACGGGGGNPGSVPGTPTPTPTPTPVVAAKVELDVSATTMPSSGADGTEVTVTAIVKDAANNALPGATVTFNVSSGTLSNTVRISDASGRVVEKLSTKGDTTARTITITASSGPATSPARQVIVAAAASVQSKLLLTSSSGTLNSSGGAGTAVQIRALVLDTNNVVVPNAVVSFSTDSGALSASTRTTDSNGQASVNLDTGTDPTSRVINVTGSVSGATASVVQVTVAGTKIAINAPVTVNVGAKVDVTATLTDSNGVPLANRAVTFSSTRNPLTTKAGAPSPAMTDVSGRLVLSYTATAAGSDVITVRALGETVTAALTVVASDFSVKVVDALGADKPVANTDTCNIVSIRNFVGATAQTGQVSVSSSRGSVYADANCTTLLGGSLNLVAGTATAYVRANSPGIATLTATSSSSQVQGLIEFVSPLIPSASISLQATPNTVGANVAGSSSQQVVLRALVSDKPSQGNPVKNARVAFSIVSDSSGGTLSQPSEVLTGADGVATVSFIPGATTTAVDGVRIQARVISDVTAASAVASLTVAQRSLFIGAGTGNTVVIPTSSTYQIDYSVFVSDAAGNAVANVNITAAARPRFYRKGVLVLLTAAGPWVPMVSATCPNEDVDRDGVLGPNEDTNGNGRLDPVIPYAITSTATTGAQGTAIISLTYPKDRANWLDADLTFTGPVAGSESSYVGYTVLPGAFIDFGATGTPPGVVSPYGTSTSCSDTL